MLSAEVCSLFLVKSGAIFPSRFGSAVATFEATEAAASVVFRTVASVKTILRPVKFYI